MTHRHPIPSRDDDPRAWTRSHESEVDPALSPEEAAAEAEVRGWVAEVWAMCLSPREQAVLEARLEGLSLEATGARIAPLRVWRDPRGPVSRERVRQIEREALAVIQEGVAKRMRPSLDTRARWPWVGGPARRP